MIHEFDFYKYEKLRDNLYVVRETVDIHKENNPKCYNIFVAVGKNHVGIFDTGMGFNDGLRRYIEANITDKKPMTAYLSHGDIDHIGGACLFDEYYMSHRDLGKAKWHLSIERKLAEVSNFCGQDPEIMEFARQHYVKNDDFSAKVKDLKHADRIDLGDTEFEVFALPGHTDGSVAFYNRKENYAIMGDAVLSTTSWGRCHDYQECYESYAAFINAVPDDILLYSNHDYPTQGMQELKDLKQAFEEILTGKKEGDEHFTLAFDFLPKELMDPEEFEYDMWCHTVGTAKVPYNANMLK